MLNSNTSDAYSHKCLKIKIKSDDDLPLQKRMNMPNVVILIKFIFK